VSHSPRDPGPAAASTTTLDALPQSEDGARDMLERARWPNGASCPHCDAPAAYRLTPRPGSTTRSDLWKCRACRRQFTVSFGTILEASRLKRAVWLKAIFLLCSSGRVVPVHQLHEMLGIHYDSAASMTRRVRYALEQARRPPLRIAGSDDTGSSADLWPGAREHATHFALACRPALDFGDTLASILAVPPEPSPRVVLSSMVAATADAP